MLSNKTNTWNVLFANKAINHEDMYQETLLTVNFSFDFNSPWLISIKSHKSRLAEKPFFCYLVKIAIGRHKKTFLLLANKTFLNKRVFLQHSIIIIIIIADRINTIIPSKKMAWTHHLTVRKLPRDLFFAFWVTALLVIDHIMLLSRSKQVMFGVFHIFMDYLCQRLRNPLKRQIAEGGAFPSQSRILNQDLSLHTK